VSGGHLGIDAHQELGVVGKLRPPMPCEPGLERLAHARRRASSKSA
jgi:hypothetical protein